MNNNLNQSQSVGINNIQPVAKTKKKKSDIIIIVAVILMVLLGIGLYVINNQSEDSSSATNSSKTTPKVTNKTISKVFDKCTDFVSLPLAAYYFDENVRRVVANTSTIKVPKDSFFYNEDGFPNGREGNTMKAYTTSGEIIEYYKALISFIMHYQTKDGIRYHLFVENGLGVDSTNTYKQENGYKWKNNNNEIELEIPNGIPDPAFGILYLKAKVTDNENNPLEITDPTSFAQSIYELVQ